MILLDIIDEIDYVSFQGNYLAVIKSPCSIDSKDITSSSIYWCSDNKWDVLDNINVGTVIVGFKYSRVKTNPNINYIFVENPRQVFMEVMNKFFKEENTYSIGNDSLIPYKYIAGENFRVGQNVVIEDGCSIGNNVTIHHNTVIFRGTIIGHNVTIGANTTIGGVGFGYEKDKDGLYCLIPHLGNVVIGNHVDIGNNTAIDRAVLGSTIIEDHCKIDNLVHIAHGVKIGTHSMIIANCMIAGSVVIGANSWISPSSSILNQKTIGEHATVGMGAVVIKDVNNNEVVVGNPSRVINTK